MTRPVDLPTDDQVSGAWAELAADANDGGPRPSVVALARRLGLTNSTFWRHFPDHARRVADHARSGSHETPPPEPRASPGGQPDRCTNPSRHNQDLQTQLHLAAANIAELTIENHELRTALEAALNVSRIPPRTPT